MTTDTLRPVAIRNIGMLVHPRCAGIMHAVWAAIGGGNAGFMAGRALGDFSRRALKIDALQVVVGLRAFVFGVCRAMAGGALQIAVTNRVAVQRSARYRESCIGSRPQVTR